MFLTGGGACIWWILDIVMIATGEFRDRSGARLLEWGVDAADSERLSTREVLEEIESINEDLDEVAERLEATERRLGRPDSNAVEVVALGCGHILTDSDVVRFRCNV